MSSEKLQEIGDRVQEVKRKIGSISSDIWFHSGKESESFRRVQEVHDALQRLEWALDREGEGMGASLPE